MDSENMRHLVNFEDMAWTRMAVGARAKIFIHEKQRIRLVEFSGGFIEPDWCTNGHTGYVLDGSFSIDYDGRVESYGKGDVLFISGGEKDKHKAIIPAGGRVQLLLVEIIA